MLDHFNIKSALVGGALGLAVGGGIYGLYMKALAPAAFSEASAYGLIGKCVELNTNKTMIPVREKEIESFLNSVEKKSPEIFKADAVVTGVAIAAGERDIPAGMGTPLRMCIQDLKKSLENAKKLQRHR
jgi:hypothetical protein